MIRMLMGEQNGTELLRIKADGRHAAAKFFAGKTGINGESKISGRNYHTVSGAASAKYSQFYHLFLNRHSSA